MFFLASHADVLRGSSRVPAWRTPKNVCVRGYVFPSEGPMGRLTLIQQTKTYKLQMSTDKTMSITQIYEDNIYLKCRDHDLDIKL